MPFPVSYTRYIEIPDDLTNPEVAAAVLLCAAASLRTNSLMDVEQAGTIVRFTQRAGFISWNASWKRSCVAYPDQGVLELALNRPSPALRLHVGSYKMMVIEGVALAVVLGYIARELPVVYILPIWAFGWIWAITAYHVQRVLMVRRFLRTNVASWHEGTRSMTTG